MIYGNGLGVIPVNFTKRVSPVKANLRPIPLFFGQVHNQKITECGSTAVNVGYLG